MCKVIGTLFLLWFVMFVIGRIPLEEKTFPKWLGDMVKEKAPEPA